jgi:hypothetical protein
MVIKLIASRDLSNFPETKVVVKGLIERKYHMNKVPAQLGDPGNALVIIVYRNHCLGSVERNRSQRFKFRHEMLKQTQCVFRFTGQEGFNRRVFRIIHGLKDNQELKKAVLLPKL